MPSDEWLLEIRETNSRLNGPGIAVSEFREGRQSDAARERYQQIVKALEEGYFQEAIGVAQSAASLEAPLLNTVRKGINDLVNSISSNVGRAIVGLFVLQCLVKSICPDQSVRLHKGGSPKSFGWVEGISMRTLDKNYVTPTLRANGLLSLNADGCFMTRSLAENYPYSRLYKADVRGARRQWLELVDVLESEPIAARSVLIYLLRRLEAERRSLADSNAQLLHLLASKDWGFDSVLDATSFALEFLDLTSHPARVFEIMLHAALQVIEDFERLDGQLVPLSQMRSANKKHGNIADVEVAADASSPYIVHAWDAKYGKKYLGDEVEELAEKLGGREGIESAGFVTSGEPDLRRDLLDRIDELEAELGVRISIESFENWVVDLLDHYGVDETEFANQWLTAFGETIALARPDRAPIDEPTKAWVDTLVSQVGSAID